MCILDYEQKGGERIMKKQLIIFTLLLASVGASAQTGGIAKVLQSIETNNKELRAYRQLNASRKIDNQTTNNLQDPTVSYSHLFSTPSGTGKSTELTVSQGFDFPTLYGKRSELNRLKAAALDREDGGLRRELLLKTKDLCLDIIFLNKQKALLDERLKNASELSDLYRRRLELGDASSLEGNKVSLELLNARTESMMNETARQTKLQELAAMNGNQPIELTDTNYLPVEAADIAQLKQESLLADADIQLLDSEREVAKQQLSVSKAQWLPKLELGYRRNTGAGEQFNGVLVGISIPLFQNKNKVNLAKAQSLYVDMKKESTTQQLESRISQLYKESEMLQSSMKAYNHAAISGNLSLLNEALRVRQISLIEYFTEVSVVFQARGNYMELENRYQKVMAQLLKYKL